MLRDNRYQYGKAIRLAACLFVLPVMLVLGAAVFWFPPLAQPGYSPINPPPIPTYEVDLVHLNLATAEELQVLPGIGPKRAQGIVEYRKQHGAFQSVEQLGEVEGISPRIIQGLEELVCIQCSGIEKAAE